jgi:hypothetical protein
MISWTVRKIGQIFKRKTEKEQNTEWDSELRHHVVGDYQHFRGVCLKAAGSSETSVTIYLITLCRKPEDHNLNQFSNPSRFLIPLLQCQQLTWVATISNMQTIFDQQASIHIPAHARTHTHTHTQKRYTFWDQWKMILESQACTVSSVNVTRCMLDRSAALLRQCIMNTHNTYNYTNQTSQIRHSIQ